MDYFYDAFEASPFIAITRKRVTCKINKIPFVFHARTSNGFLRRCVLRPHRANKNVIVRVSGKCGKPVFIYSCERIAKAISDQLYVILSVMYICTLKLGLQMSKPAFNLSHYQGCLINLYGIMGVLHWALLTLLIRSWKNQPTVLAM